MGSGKSRKYQLIMWPVAEMRTVINIFPHFDINICVSASQIVFSVSAISLPSNIICKSIMANFLSIYVIGYQKGVCDLARYEMNNPQKFLK